MTCPAKAQFTVTYSSVTAPSTAGSNIFTTKTKQAGGTLTNITSGQPVVNVNQAPAITSANSTTFTAGTAGSFTVTTTGLPTPTLTRGGVALPSGVTFTDNGDGTGTLSGTPAAGTGGTYAITFTAANGVGSNAVQNFNLTVNQAPAITSANNATFKVGTAGSFTVTTTGFPAPTLSESGALPSGVTFNAATGVLSGTPAANTGGTYPITITASNGITPNATQSFTLTVHQAPAITSANSTTFTVGTGGIVHGHSHGLPGTDIHRDRRPAERRDAECDDRRAERHPGREHGRHLPHHHHCVQRRAPNATQNFTLTVNQAPAITSANSATFKVGTAGTFTVTTTGFPAPTLSESGALPSGVTFNTATGVLSGTPAANTGGTYPITITASNGITPNATQSFTLTVQQAPAITSANSTTFTVGTAGTFTVTATGFPAPTFSETGALPSGVTLNTTTGALSGTPAANTGGTYPITITACQRRLAERHPELHPHGQPGARHHQCEQHNIHDWHRRRHSP